MSHNWLQRLTYSLVSIQVKTDEHASVIAKRAYSMVDASREHIVAPPAGTNTSPVYLTHEDLSLRYVWVGVTFAFPYQINATRLKTALHHVVHTFPILAGRYRSAAVVKAAG